MRREDLDHVLHAAADVTEEVEFVVIGSQAVLGEVPDAPAALLISMEADIYPRASPQKADLIDGAIGDGSEFHPLAIGPVGGRWRCSWKDTPDSSSWTRSFSGHRRYRSRTPRSS